MPDPRISNAHNVEAEQVLLGAMMSDNSIIDQVFEIARPEDFFEDVHRVIAEAIEKAALDGRVANPITLKGIADGNPAFQDLGGGRYLMELTGSLVVGLVWREYAQLIAELARIREIHTATAGMVHDYLDGHSTFDQATGQVDDALARAAAASSIEKPLSAADMISAVSARSDRITEEAVAGDLGVRTSTVTDLNTLLSPIEDGSYIVLGGRPSMGKSTLGMSAAWGFAANGFPTLVLAAEGRRDALAMRLCADLSLDTPMPLTHDQIRHDKLTREERGHFGAIRDRAATLPIDYQLVGHADIRRVRAQVARAVQKWKAKGQRLRVVVVDYLQLLTASQNGREISDERLRVNAVSKGLVSICNDFGVTVIALSQLNRTLEQREDKRPRLSDLRESGRLEEDADAVLFVYREEYYLERSKPVPGQKDFEALYQDWQSDLARARNRIDLILAKNRDGSIKTRTAKFYGQYTAIRGGDYDDSSLDNAFDFADPMKPEPST